MANPPKNLETPPPPTSFLNLTFPSPRILVVTMTREKDLNCTSRSAILELTSIFRWFDSEPALTVAILTGAGTKSFSTGADLKEWNRSVAEAKAKGLATENLGPGNVPGAEALSNRRGKKPVIAAVNGMALGGGCENVLNCDIVLASSTATFGCVEVQRGLAAYSGALPRLIRIVGLQRASEFALTGKVISAKKAMEWGIVNAVVEPGELMGEALKWAQEIAAISPDSIICTRAMLREGWSTADVVEATNTSNAGVWAELQRGENMQEGLKAFQEKRKPVWGKPRL